MSARGGRGWEGGGGGEGEDDFASDFPTSGRLVLPPTGVLEEG